MGDLIARGMAADNAKYLSAPLASVTYNLNPEIVVSAVDFDTNTFTSVAHGLANNARIAPIANYPIELIYPQSLYPTGLEYTDNGYYVINKTDDTFQVSATIGGEAVALSTKATMDLAKWHFEKLNGGSYNILNLGSAYKFRIIIKGRNLIKSAYMYVGPYGLDITGSKWFKPPNMVYTNAGLACYGDVMIDESILIDYSKYLTIKAEGIYVRTASDVAVVATVTDMQVISPLYRTTLFSGISFVSHYFANGTAIEVYKA